MISWLRPHRPILIQTLGVLFLLVLGSIRPSALLAQSDVMVGVTLEDAIRLALEHDPATVAAESGVAIAEAGMWEARGAWLPGLSLNSAYSNSSNQRFDQATGRLVSESYTAATAVSYDLFSGGRRFFQHRSARARLSAADAAYRAQRYQTVLRAIESFYGAVAAEELVDVMRQRMQRARRQLEFAEVRIEVGTATRSDQLRAELELGNAELALVDADFAMQSARRRLGRLLGIEGGVAPITSGEGTVPTSGELPERSPELPPAAELYRRAELNSPELLAARAALDERRAVRWESRSSYLPTLRLTGGYDWFSFSFPPDQRSWSLRVIASLPLFNGFQREASVSRAAAAERSARARARDAELATRVAVEDALQEIASAERRVIISQRGVELAREDLRVQEERYQIGNSTIIDLQASQVALADAEAAEIRARQALGVALARLEAVLGERLGEEY